MSATKPVAAVLAATDDHLQAIGHYAHSAELRGAMDTVGKMLDALQHLVRWHDQLTPADIARAKAVIAQAIGSST